MTQQPSPRLPAALRRLRGDDGGSTSISFAIVFPVVLVLVMLVVQAGLFWWARDVARTAASEGASVARSYRSARYAGARQADLVLKQFGDGLTLRPSAESQLPQRAEVKVTVQVEAQSVLPFIPRMWITASVTSPKEAWLP